MQVQPAYADQQLPEPDLFMADSELDEQTAELARQQLARQRAALAESVYPCRVHRPRLFFRWAGGHLALEHDRKACPDCLNDTPRKGARRRSFSAVANEPTEPERERYP